MKQKLFRSLLWLTWVSAFLLTTLFLWLTYRYIEMDSYDGLKREAKILAACSNEHISEAYLKKLPLNDRITLIAPNGKALYDNYADYDAMENHLQREEVFDAIKTGEGMSSRASETLGEDILYYAMRMPDGNILRLARTNDAILQQANTLFWYLMVIFLLVLAGAFLAAKSVTRKALRPLEQLDLEAVATSKEDIYPELQPIVEYFSLQQQRLVREMRRYKNKKQELKAVTNNMEEGMLFLDNNWEILSINKSAVKFFGVEKQELLGFSLEELVANDEITKFLQKIKIDGKGTLVWHKGNSYYQFNGSKVFEKGFVVLIMDVTERTISEKIRREFSANVSHELKTPLQSVLGYSEIMLSGLVKEEDTKRFLQKIYDEAHNLLKLIDDIIKLSRLDELNHDTLEEFTLQQVALNSCNRLKDKATKMQIQLNFIDTTNGKCQMIGIASLMEEIFFNLLDNGLKYNFSGGKVTFKLAESENKYIISIVNTGMGIAAEELPYIFKRFYRVDRSRHKAIEGTGLGLSIVKHGVLFHGGKINVFSSPGKETEFILKFPKTITSIQDSSSIM